MPKRYYIWSGLYVGNDMLWWAKNRSGYTCQIDEAEEYTEEEAKQILSRLSSRDDAAFNADYVRECASLCVDAQRIDREKAKIFDGAAR